MDGHEHEGLSDGVLERDIEAVLGVDPSPEFLPRLRARMADECMHQGRLWLSPWRWAGAVAVVTGVAVVAVWSLREPVTAPREVQISTPTVKPSPAAPDPVASTADSPAPEGRPVARTVRSKRPAGVARPEVVISRDEVVALRHLVVAIVARQVKAVDFPKLGEESAPLPAIEEIVLEPITLSPIDGVLE